PLEGLALRPKDEPAGLQNAGQGGVDLGPQGPHAGGEVQEGDGRAGIGHSPGVRREGAVRGGTGALASARCSRRTTRSSQRRSRSTSVRPTLRKLKNWLRPYDRW